MIMKADHIVAEVRKAGEKLAKDADYNVEKFFDNLRLKERTYQNEIADKVENSTGVAEDKSEKK